jgi:hypothetical protein
MAWVFGVVHYQIARTEVGKDGVAVVELGLLKFDCAILNVMPAGTG